MNIDIIPIAVPVPGSPVFDPSLDDTEPWEEDDDYDEDEEE